MKKILTLVLLSVLLFSLSACTGEAKDENMNTDNAVAEDKVIEDKAEDKISEDEALASEDKKEVDSQAIDTILNYYPLLKNRLMHYEGKGNEYAEMETMVEYIEDDLIQIKASNSGTNIVSVLEYKEGTLKEVFREGEFYHIENMLDASRNMDNIILKEPIEVGNSWEDAEGNKVEITSLDQDLDMPYGKYKALEVTTSYDNNAVKRDYYVKDIGYVGNIYIDGELQVETLLKDISDDGIEIPVKVYYPLIDEVGSKYINKIIEFKTNDDTKIILERLLKNPDSDKVMPTIPENSNINKINLNRDNWNLEVDLSEGFIEDMNAGSSYEIEIVNSIVNTLASFYDVERVYLTVGGEPYASGHLELLEDEYFEVYTEGIEELEQ